MSQAKKAAKAAGEAPKVEAKLIECTANFPMEEGGERYEKGDPMKVSPKRFKSLGDAVSKAN